MSPASAKAASRVDTIVRGGRIVTSTDVFEAAIAIDGDKIAAIGPEALLPPADRVIDAQGKYVLPGLIDCHLHVGPEYDDWKTAPLAAAYTGRTTLLPFVTYDEGESLPGAAARLREEASALSVLDFGFHFILNHEPYILEGIAETFRMGVTSFVNATYKKPCAWPRRVHRRTIWLAALGGLCQLHCENGDVLCYLEDKAIAQPDRAHRFPGPARLTEKRQSTAPSSSAGSPTVRVRCISALLVSTHRARRPKGRRWTETARSTARP